MLQEDRTRTVASLFAALAPVDVFPDVELVTEHLRLRPHTADDVDDHLAVFEHDLARRWSVVPRPYTRERAYDWCTRRAAQVRTSGDGICWAGEDRETGRVVGATGVHSTDWRNRVTDVSADAAREVLGKGYAREALLAISHWLLTDQRFERVQITAATENIAPQRVAEACGFVREGVMRNAGSDRYGRVDLALYALTPEELADLPPPTYRVQPHHDHHHDRTEAT